MKNVKIIGFGILNFIIRFAIGGFLFLGIKIDPVGFLYGFLLTLTAFTSSYLLLRFAIKPVKLKEALIISVIWAFMALVFDIATAEPIVRIPISSLFGEIQTWTRLSVIILAAFFATSKKR